MTIREYKEDDDYEELCRWAEEEFQAHPTRDQIPETTFIALVHGERVASVSLLLTNAKAYACPECLLSNPDSDAVERQQAVEGLLTYIEAFAKALKYRQLLLLAPNKTLVRRYRALGFTATLEGVTTMVKSLM